MKFYGQISVTRYAEDNWTPSENRAFAFESKR